MAAPKGSTTGIILVVLGVLAIAGWLNDFVVVGTGVLLLVVGLMILLKRLDAAPWIGVVCLAAGLLLLAGFGFLTTIVQGATVGVGVVLLILGVLKLAGK